ncbi:MAG TPA: citrate/2-methylcitrate synthase [Pirellulaceae bacterium]|nr:citrate/2-methylcitrate synthase [Pirellulaceae bacterium]
MTAEKPTSSNYSPGLEGVIAGETAISTVETGLTYRGYAIEDLAANSTYEEVAYLILYGELPTAAQAAAFRQRLGAAAAVPQEIIETLRRIPHAAPSMDVLRSAVSLLAHWEKEMGDNSHAANLRKTERLLAQAPVIVAARQRLMTGQEPVAADPSLTLPANFLWMLRGQKPSPKQVEALDVSLILYAEHEFNASTFSARCVVSTLSDLHSGITGAIGALKGPLHGGANEAALKVLQEVGSPDRAEAWVRGALARKQKIMGFGHRVYKDGDPRAVYLKRLTAAVAAETGQHDMEKMAEIIESIVWSEKKIPPNVDWPCARLYHYFGLPADLFTPLFVVARIVGWSAHIIEQLDNNRIVRPRSIYKGPSVRKWKPVEQR